MIGRRPIVHLAILAMILIAPIAYGDAPIVFEPLETRMRVNSMALTEDRKQLVMAHESDDKVTVWDVRTGELQHTVEVDKPRFVICRRNYAYVLNSEKATLTPMPKSQNYRAARPIPLGIVEPYFISAPRGSNYKGVMLVTGGGYSSRVVLKVTITRRKVEKVFDTMYMSIATCDYLGKHVLVQSEFSHSSHSTRRYPYAHFINPGTRKTISQGEYLGGRKNWMYQTRPEDFWVAEQQLLDGAKLSPFGGTTGDVLLADELKSMFYSIKGKSLTAHRYDKVLTELGERDVTNAPHRQNKKMGGRGGYRFIRPIAVTHTPNLYMFVHHSSTGKVHRAVTRAFSLSKTANKTAVRPKSPSPNLPEDKKPVAPTARDISALRSFAPMAMTNGDIVREFASAIVRIDDVESTHTGMIVGSRGFVLTRALKGAHPDVHYQIDVGDRSVTFKARAQVVKNDTDSNLALLKFDATSRLASVRLASDPPRKNGTNVFALGFGEKTVASGKWNTSENQPVFKPTNESPSKSGLPLFDKNGQVVGLVIDSGIMPTDILRLFLKSVIKE